MPGDRPSAPIPTVSGWSEEQIEALCERFNDERCRMGINAPKWSEWGPNDRCCMVEALKIALATLTPAPAAPVQGWKLVPREPTEEMLSVDISSVVAELPVAGDALLRRARQRVWRAMYDAAPSSPDPEAVSREAIYAARAVFALISAGKE